MLSEYDRFLAEMGEDVKIAESVDTTSFVVSEPVPIDTVPPAPVFVDPSLSLALRSRARLRILLISFPSITVRHR